MKSIPAGKAKAQLLALLDAVERSQEDVIITKRGRPVARLAPLKKTRKSSLKARLLFLGDVVTPVDETWNAP
jgi:prevent-host-death family protein